MRRIVILVVGLFLAYSVLGQSTGLAPGKSSPVLQKKQKLINQWGEDKLNEYGTIKKVDSKLIVNYQFEQTSGTFVSIAATGTAITPSGWDDGYYYLDLTGQFNFFYNGHYFSSLSIGTNGGAIVGRDDYLSLSNDLTSTTYAPVLAPFWDDMRFYGEGSGDGLFYQIDTVGTDTVLTVEWNNVCSYGDDGYPVSFQIKIHSNGVIEYVYGDMSNAGNWESSGGSIGINDNEGGSTAAFASVTPGNPATVSFTEANNQITGSDLADNIASGTIYRFTPNFFNHDLMAANIFPVAAEPGDVNMFGVIVNTGLQSATNFSVTLTIEDQDANTVYNQTINYSDTLAGGNNDTLDFGVWNAALGEYTATLEVSYADDENANNNQYETNVVISEIIKISDTNEYTTCSALFYDSGGPDGEYQSDEDYTITVYPDGPNKYMKIEFLSFAVENNFDKLYVYDGENTDAELVATLTGYDIPDPIIARNPSGALTFRFTSDGSITKAGWEAHLSCYIPPDNDLAVTNFSPTTALANQSFIPKVTIFNNGLNTQQNYQVHVWDKNGEYDQTLDGLRVERFQSVVLNFPPWNMTSDTDSVYVAVILSSDEDNTNDTLMTQIIKLNVSPIYGWDAYASSSGLPEGPVLLDTASQTLVSIAANSSDFLAGADWTKYGWTGVMYNSKDLVAIDRTSGDVTTIATLNIGSPVGFTYDRANDVAYVADYDGTNSNLYTVDLNTGETQLVGTIGDYVVIGIAANSKGDLYGVEITNNNLISIDPATGQGTVIGSLGIDISYAQDIAFDKQTDSLFGALYTTTGGLYGIDTTTGHANLIWIFGDEIDGFTFSEPAYIVTFHVTNGVNNISNAHIYIAGNEYITDNNGNAYVERYAGNFDYLVVAQGYSNVSGSVNLTGDTVINITMTPGVAEWPVTMYVYAQDFYDTDSTLFNPANGAVVTFGSENDTVVNGKIETLLPSGNNSYTITMQGYQTLNGSVNIPNDNYEFSDTIYYQKYAVTVNVYESWGANDPVPNANVTFSYGDYSWSVITGSNGSADTLLPAVDFSVVTRATGYLADTTSISVSADVSFDVYLDEEILSPTYLTHTFVNMDVDVLETWGFGEEFSENFEAGALAEGWEIEQTCTDEQGPVPGYWTVNNYTGNGIAPYGTYHAGLWWSYDHQDERLITPEFIPGSGFSLTFYSYVYQGSSHGDHYYVEVSEDGGNTWTPLWDASDLPDLGDFHTYQDDPYVIDLSAYTGKSIRLAFHADDGTGAGLYYVWFVDNITVGNGKEVISFKPEDLTHVSYSAIHVDTKATSAKLSKDPNFVPSAVASDKGGKFVQNYTIYLNGTEIATIDSTAYLFEDLTPGHYKVAVLAHFETGDADTAYDEFTIAGVTFHVEDTYGNAIENANVIVNQNDTQIASGTTDANGDISFTVEAGDYQYTVTADGYVPAENVDVTINGDTTINVQLVPIRTVVFHVYDSETSDDIQGASLIIKQGTSTVATGTTDANGYTSIDLAEGDYNYTVSATGYNSIQNVDFTVNAETDTIAVAMTPALVGFGDNARIYPNPTAAKVFVENAQGYKISVMNVEGKVLYQTNSVSDRTEIDLSGFDAGVYLIRLENSGNVEEYKVIKK